MSLLIAPRKNGNLNMKSNFWQKNLFRYKMPARTIGEVGDKTVLYIELPWSMAELQGLGHRKLKKNLKAVGRFASKKSKVNSCKIIGMSYELQEFFREKEVLELLKSPVADGRFLWVENVKSLLEAYIGSLENQEITIWGIEEIWHKILVDELLAAGVKPILVGGRAASLSEYYFQTLGIAMPVLKGKKALSTKAMVYIPQGKVADNLAKIPNVFILEEVNLKVLGSFLEPFAFGFFPAGMAAALKVDGADVLLDKSSHKSYN